jgi:hypothetical protein
MPITHMQHAQQQANFLKKQMQELQVLWWFK